MTALGGKEKDPVPEPNPAYLLESGITGYEVFLAASTQKRVLGTFLAGILNHIPIVSYDLLDIGAGDGKLWEEMANAGVDIQRYIYHGLEPNEHYLTLLQKRMRGLLNGEGRVWLVNQFYERYTSRKKFGVILASHLYHSKPEELEAEHERMIRSLVRGGSLIYVRWKPDDLIAFKEAFRGSVQDPGSVWVSFDDAMQTFRSIATRIPLSINEYTLHSELRFPLDSPDNTKKIIEFATDNTWPKALPGERILDPTYLAMLGYIHQHGGVFNLIEGVAVVHTLPGEGTIYHIGSSRAGEIMLNGGGQLTAVGK